MIEGVDEVDAEIDAPLSFTAEERQRKIFRKREVKELLTRRTNIQRARSIAQTSLDRTHECCGVDERLATGRRRRRTGRAATLPQRITQWNARHDIRPHVTVKEHTSKSIRIRYEWQKREAAGHPQHPGHAPASDDRVYWARRILQVTAVASDGNVPNAGRDEIILDVESRDGSILFQVSTE